MKKFIVIGLTPQGLALLRLLSRAGHQVFAFSRSNNVSGMYSRYGKKILFSSTEDLKAKVSSIVEQSDIPVKCIIASGELLALILEGFPELYDICTVESGPFDIVKMLSYKNHMYNFARSRGLVTAKFCLLTELEQETISFPVILKRNYEVPMPFKIKIFEDKSDFISFTKSLPSMLSKHILIQELVKVDAAVNYSCQVYVKHGEVQLHLCCIQGRRTSSGITSFLIEVNDDEIENALVNSAVNLFRDTGYTGFAELEFLYSPIEKTFSFIEVNTRPCGLQSSLHHKFKGISAVYDDDFSTNQITRSPERLIWINMARDLRSRIEERYFGKLWQFFCAKKDVFDWRDPVPFFLQFLR